MIGTTHICYDCHIRMCVTQIYWSLKKLNRFIFVKMLYTTWECHWPVDQQVLLHSEALRTGVALGFVLGPSWFGWGFARFILVTLQLWELQHLVLFDATVVPRLLPHPRRVNHQRVLETDSMKNLVGVPIWPRCSSLLECIFLLLLFTKNLVSITDGLKSNNKHSTLCITYYVLPMISVNPVNICHLLYEIGLIGYLAPCFFPDAEKITAQLKHKLALIMLSNELHFCSIN